MLRNDQKFSRFSLLTKITAFTTLGYLKVGVCQGSQAAKLESWISPLGKGV